MNIKIDVGFIKKFLVILFLITGFLALLINLYYQQQNVFKTHQIVITQVGQLAGHFVRGKPIDRYYIEKFLDQNRKYIKGHVLEMADNHYTMTYGENIVKSDVLDLSEENKKATMVHDLQDPSWFPAEKFDCYICTQTLPYLYDIKAGFKSAYKMLKKDGVFLVTAPGISQLSFEPGVYDEYWHFTEKTLYKLAKEAGFREIKVYTYGNTLTATAFLQGLAVEDLKDKSVLDIKDEWYPVTVTLVAIK